MPIPVTANSGLITAGYSGDDAVDAVADPTGFVVVEKGDRAVFWHGERDVCAIIFGVEAVVVVPTVIERGFVFVVASSEVEGGDIDVVARIVGQHAVGAFGVPFP